MMKKRIFALFLLMIFAFSLASCLKKEGFGDEKLYFHARIIALEGTEMLVGGGDIGLCIVDFPETVDLSDYERGDYVKIAHSGSIAESYPTQARGYAVQFLSMSEIKDFRKEVNLSGVIETITEDEVFIRAEDTLYKIRKENLKDNEDALTEGASVNVTYDGIIDSGLGISEICFPTSITQTADE